MRKITIVLIFCFTYFHIFGQEVEEQTIFFMENNNGIIYIDNSKGAYFTVEFPGDSLIETEIPNAYLIDDNFFQIMKYKYSSKQYSNKSDTTKEIELLKFYEKYETDYLEKEVYKQEITVSNEMFKNKEGKRFYLWYYQMPELEQKQDTDEIEEVATHQLYLTFVCNENVCGIYMPVTSKEAFNDKIEIIKTISENIDIYGYKVDLNALFYKIDAQNEGRELQYADTIRGFEFDIPNWLNLTENNSNKYWIATMPDIDNVKNAVLVQWFDKSDFKSLKKFNKAKIENKKLGDRVGNTIWMLKKELPTPENCNGICYKVNLMSGKTIYHSQQVTYKTKKAYLLVTFTATDKTYEKNLPKFEAFLKGIVIRE